MEVNLMAVIHKGTPKDWIERFKSFSLHVVCVASGGLTTCDFAASTIGGMKQEQEVWPLTKRVNQLGETGTFWPRLPLTVVPQTAFNGRPPIENIDDFLRNCFLDVAEANRLHIKQSDVYVDLNPYGGRFEMEKALLIARQILSQESSIQNLWFADAAL
jgi:hypothetical protein